MARPNWYKCIICGYGYPESELVIDPDIGCVCNRCRAGMKELDQEQEDIEQEMREEQDEIELLLDAERKMKAGII